MMEKVLADQRGRNVEVYLEEIVKKIKNEYSLIQDVEETLSKLRRVNIKIDPNASTFGINEGKLLRHLVTKEGVRADPEKVHAIIRSPVPKNMKQSAPYYLWKGKESKYPSPTRANQYKDPEGPLVNKFLGQGKHELGTSGASREETILVGKELEPNLTPTPKAWRLYIGNEAVEEGSGIGIILVSPDETIRSYAILLNFKASEHSRDYEALLAGLVASVGQDIKDLHVFIDSSTLAAQMERSYAPVMRQERKYKEEIMDATTLFHRFRITYLPKILNPKVEVLTGLATIKLEFLNQEVSVGIKTRPSVEETSSSKKGNAVSNVLGAKPNYNYEISGRNIMDEVDIEDLTIEQYLRLTQENQTPKKIEDMTIAEYVEYEKKMNENHISNTKSYLPTYFSKSAPTHDLIQEFAHYFGPNQPVAESDYDSEDMEEEVEYMTNDEVVMSEQEESNHGNTQNIQHFEEKDDVDKWLNTKITKHLSMQGVKNTEDALISIIKSIKRR
ncbi:reverse transcriptase domain-containing protein [Tanacetum coccineum]